MELPVFILEKGKTGGCLQISEKLSGYGFKLNTCYQRRKVMPIHNYMYVNIHTCVMYMCIFLCVYIHRYTHTYT